MTVTARRRGFKAVVSVADQGPGTLGDRLVRVLDGAFRDGAPVAAVLGSDHPITKTYRTRMFNYLY